MYDVICSLRDYLSFLNPQTTAAVLKRQNEQHAAEMKAIAEEKERQAKLMAQKIREKKIEMAKQLIEETRWRENLGINEGSIINDDFGLEKDTQSEKLNRKTSLAPEPKKTSPENLDQSGLPLEKVEQVSRYQTDFIELEKIGEGGFGHVWKARHKLDGNIYAIKKVKLSNNNEENRRIKREVTYLSSLNSPYIVRYFQTWVEVERDPERIKELAGSEDYYDEEYEDEEDQDLEDSFTDYSEMKRSARIARASANRTNSAERKNKEKPSISLIKALQASPDEEESESALLRKRAKTDNIEVSDSKTNELSQSISGSNDIQYVLGHEQQDGWSESRLTSSKSDETKQEE